jgi:hypothetical protein
MGKRSREPGDRWTRRIILHDISPQTKQSQSYADQQHMAKNMASENRDHISPHNSTAPIPPSTIFPPKRVHGLLRRHSNTKTFINPGNLWVNIKWRVNTKHYSLLIVWNFGFRNVSVTTETDELAIWVFSWIIYWNYNLSVWNFLNFFIRI